MAILNFPDNPVNGQVYPSNPLPGQNVYYWDSAYRTWRLTGSATGVASGTYGTSTSVPQLTVDVSGRITFVDDIDISVPLASTTSPGLVQPDGVTIVVSPAGVISAVGGGSGSGSVALVNTGIGLTGGPIVTTGTISLEPATTSTLGGVIPDGTTVTVSPTGVISAVGGGGSVGTLQEVTDAGNQTTNSIIVSNGGYTSNLAPSSLTLSNPGGSVQPATTALVNGDRITLSVSGGGTTISLDSASGQANVASLIAAGLTYPVTDGAAGQFLTTDGAGTLSWGTGGGGSVGTLQDVTNNGATTTNPITVAGLTAANLSYPTSDGTAGQVLTTDGAGTLSWGSASLPSRTVVSGTTTSVAYLDLVTLDIQGFKSYLLMKIECDGSAWVRLYTDPGARTADLSRNIGNDPNPGSGVIAEANIVAPSTTSIMSPFTPGGNLGTPETDTIYLTVQNLSGVTRAFNVSLTVLQLGI